MQYLVGQFGGFPLRVSWLPRLVNRYAQERCIPVNPEVIAVDLGVGKNMAKAMRAWGRAAGIVDDKGFLTGRATQIFIDFDPYLERGESVALLHWYIASNFEKFTACAWLFNFLKVDHLSIRDSASEFMHFLNLKKSKYAEGTIRGDIEPVLRMHIPPEDLNIDELGDKFFSKLSLLNCTKSRGHTSVKRTWVNERVHISDRIIEHAILCSFANRRSSSAAFSSLYSGKSEWPSPGYVFGLTKDGFFASIERICRRKQSCLELSSMPGEDALVIARGEISHACARGELELIDRRFFN